VARLRGVENQKGGFYFSRIFSGQNNLEIRDSREYASAGLFYEDTSLNDHAVLDNHSWVQLPDGSHVEVTYEKPAAFYLGVPVPLALLAGSGIVRTTTLLFALCESTGNTL
jgi:hypothetical protein